MIQRILTWIMLQFPDGMYSLARWLVALALGSLLAFLVWMLLMLAIDTLRRRRS